VAHGLADEILWMASRITRGIQLKKEVSTKNIMLLKIVVDSNHILFWSLNASVRDPIPYPPSTRMREISEM